MNLGALYAALSALGFKRGGGGGGGSSTLAALTDMGSYDIGSNNPSVTTIKNTANAAIPAAQKGAASGVATLDGTTHIPAAQIPAPTATTLGGVQSAAAVAHQFVTSISTAGVLALAQPSSADLSDLATVLTGPIATNAAAIATNTAALSVQTDNGQIGTAYTLVLADAGQNVDMNNAAANTLTIPPNSAVAFPVGTIVTVTMAGAGVTTIAAGAGVTINKPVARSLSISANLETAQLYQASKDVWRVLAG